MGITYRDEERERVLHSMLDLFYVVNRYENDWSDIEEMLVNTPYDEFAKEERDLFIEFLAGLCLRVWYGRHYKMNEVIEVDTGFIIRNYDWNTYKWAHDHHVSRECITPSHVGVPFSLLNNKLIEWFRSKK